MAHNPTMANALGVSQENRNKIDAIHKILELAVGEDLYPEFFHSIYKTIEDEEYRLQSLWGFPQDGSKHTWKNLYKFRVEWSGRTYVCNTTGEEFTVPWDVRERDFYAFGEAYLDVGTLDGYYRISNCTERY